MVLDERVVVVGGSLTGNVTLSYDLWEVMLPYEAIKHHNMHIVIPYDPIFHFLRNG